MTPNAPPRYKTALLIWLAIYPSINLLFWMLGDWLLQFPLLIRTLVLTGILVPLMVFVLLPLLQKLFRRWLFPTARH
jgi:antibiotic biosynthesis monooxygenase (ABM) superfamily enzyme